MAFIVIEGIDGAGKSTVCAAVGKALEAGGRRVRLLREPGSTPLGEHVRSILLDPGVGDLHPWTEACLFTACRAEMGALRVRPALAAGEDVILDRYFYSTLAYQGFARDLDVGTLTRLNLDAVEELEPDCVLLLDLDVGSAHSRLGATRDRMEARGAAYLQRVRDGYLELARRDPGRWRVLDAVRPAAEVAARAVELARQALQAAGGTG